MQHHEIKGWKKDASVRQIVEATFPQYNKRKITVMAVEEVMLYDLNWSGGTRSEYKACTLDGKKLGDSSKYNAQAPWDNQAEGKRIPIPAGMVMVRGGYFCGQESTLCIYVNPVDMPKYLEHAK